MNRFKDWPITRKLLAAFCASAVLTAVLGVAGLTRMQQMHEQTTLINEQIVPVLSRLSELRAFGGEFRVYEVGQFVNFENPERYAYFLKRMDEIQAKYVQTQASLDKTLPADSPLRPDYAKLADAGKRYFEANAELRTLYAQPDHAPAMQFSTKTSGEIRKEVFAAIDKMYAAQSKALGDMVTASDAGFRTTSIVLVAGTAVMTVLSILFGLLIARAIARPLGEASRVARAIALGKLDNAISVSSRDETGQLLDSMGTMQAQLQAVLAEQREMARQHTAGMISYRMDEARFPGDYGAMVRDSNALVAEHIGVKMQVIELTKRYAIGDLSLDMERLPGEKAVISETMDAVKRNLGAINNEIKHLGAAAANGDFSVRGDAEAFQYDFRDMVDTLNRLMQTTGSNLDQLSVLLKAIAEGDLTARMDGEFRGVFARMRDDANATVTQLTDIVGRIQHASTSINTAAGEIASGNDDLSRRTEQQAANLEETAASMEELTSTVKQNAEHARQANQLAQGAAGVARDGGDVVGQVVSTMSDIEASSKKIAEIISVIDGIAFQTNILALNAAVEAARAGEQGRGFAVVASEVRTLAQRSANAAKEIKGLIDDSVERVADGSALVHKAGSTMSEIVASVQRVTDIMAEISAASQEQSSGIEQVNQTVTQMDETTQQNAALVEEATAAARSLEEQAGQLNGAVAVFKLRADASGARVLQMPPTAAPRSAPVPVPVPVPAPRAAPARPLKSAGGAAPALPADDWSEF